MFSAVLSLSIIYFIQGPIAPFKFKIMEISVIDTKSNGAGGSKLRTNILVIVHAKVTDDGAAWHGRRQGGGEAERQGASQLTSILRQSAH